MPDDNQSYEPLNITRTFAAPRAIVWKAWTDPKIFSQWWNPDGFTIPICELDVRQGGTVHIVMRGPDGTDYPMDGTYIEVVETERIVWTNWPLDNKGKPLFEVRQTITLTEENGSTTLDISAEVLSAGPNAALPLSGMEAGLTQCLEKLANTLRN